MEKYLVCQDVVTACLSSWVWPYKGECGLDVGMAVLSLRVAKAVSMAWVSHSLAVGMARQRGGSAYGHVSMVLGMPLVWA